MIVMKHEQTKAIFCKVMTLRRVDAASSRRPGDLFSQHANSNVVRSEETGLTAYLLSAVDCMNGTCSGRVIKQRPHHRP